MSKPTTNANIVLPDGTYYPVKLTWIPQADDTIELESHIDKFKKAFTVDRVVHHVRDVSERIEGAHSVSVRVK